ncbi:serine/threonine-protein phosphatase 4 regulatory subunit 2-B [Stigmatopora nigra]
MEIESLQEALRDFEKKPKREPCPILEQFLCHVAKTGETMVQWSQFKDYFLFKLEKVMDDFRASAPEQRGPANPNVESVPFEDMKERILKIVDGYNGIPFTIQRLCELLTEPKRNYTGTDKFLRGVEKNVMVVSCVHPTSEKNGCSAVNRMNGVMLTGNTSSFTERKVNGPGTPRPLNRPKLSLANSLAANGLPDSTENKDLKTDQESVKDVSGSEVSASGESLGSSVKNKHSDTEEDVESEREVKRLKFGEEEDEEEDEEEEEEDEEEEEEPEGEMQQPVYGTCLSKEAEAMVQEEEKVHSKEDASCSAKDQEPTSSTQAETRSDEELTERDGMCRSENDTSDVDQAKQVPPAGVARSPETNAESEEFPSDPVSSSSSSSSSSSNSSSCSIDEGVEVAPEEDSPTPSSSTNEPSSDGGMENASADIGTADKPLEQD